jgi:sulfatase maturation enzyme AslB (radical SAM superfamily)
MYMYIGIEITSRCNAKCPWCFAIKGHHGTSPATGNGFMTFDSFKSIVNRLLEQGLVHRKTILNLYAIGEPFLNKRLPEDV